MEYVFVLLDNMVLLCFSICQSVCCIQGKQLLFIIKSWVAIGGVVVVIVFVVVICYCFVVNTSIGILCIIAPLC